MYKTQKDLQQRSHHAPPQIPNDPRVSHSSLRKSKKNFTKPMPPLDPSTSDLQNPGKSTPKVQPHAPKRSHDLSNDPRPRPSNMCKFAHDFGKLTIPWSSTALDRQSPKKFEIKEAAMHLHVPSAMRHRCYSLRLMCRHAHLHHHTRHTHYTRALCAWRHPTLPRFDLDRPGNLTRSEPLAKKKLKKKKLWPSRTLTSTKKSKFSKMACSIQFFEYIPILRSVSSFKARKLCKFSNS